MATVVPLLCIEMSLWGNVINILEHRFIFASKIVVLPLFFCLVIFTYVLVYYMCYMIIRLCVIR